MTMTGERIAVLADIHGNIWALDAVLAEIDRQGITSIVDLGDSTWGPFAPAETAARLLARQIPSIAGNCDRLMLDPTAEVGPSLQHARAELTEEHLAWVRSLPPTRVVGDLFLCHGTPADDDIYLLETPTPNGSVLRVASEIAAELAGIAQPVVLCGHSHIPRVVRLTSGHLVVNPGSVGMQGYDMDSYIMESGSPHARYAVLTRRDVGWDVALHAVAYDWEAAAQAAERNGQSDRARIERTGRVRA